MLKRELSKISTSNDIEAYIEAGSELSVLHRCDSANEIAGASTDDDILVGDDFSSSTGSSEPEISNEEDKGLDHEEFSENKEDEGKDTPSVGEPDKPCDNVEGESQKPPETSERERTSSEEERLTVSPADSDGNNGTNNRRKISRRKISRQETSEVQKEIISRQNSRDIVLQNIQSEETVETKGNSDEHREIRNDEETLEILDECHE